MKTVLILPCYNEEKTLAKVIDDFRKQLPDIEIVVYDNNSQDRSVEVAQSKNVTVLREKKTRQGQCNEVCL